MVVRTEYKDRFVLAMEHAAMQEAALARALGISYQAVKKVVLGTTKEMSASNNSKAAALMGVRSDWLATGEGEMPVSPSAADFTQQALSLAALFDEIKDQDDRDQVFAICNLAITQRWPGAVSDEPTLSEIRYGTPKRPIGEPLLVSEKLPEENHTAPRSGRVPAKAR